MPMNDFLDADDIDAIDPADIDWKATAENLQQEVNRLRGELDSGDTRTEWATEWTDGGYCPSPRGEQSARDHARNFGTKLVQRSVGPWVPVEDEAGGS